jgi:SAM-dependent methyltransferase
VTQADAEQHVRQLAAESIAADDPTGWFERLYAEAEQGQAVVPWFRGVPRPTLVQWAERRRLEARAGQRAIVIGCGLGDDAEYLAGLGFRTVAFDISASAVRGARRRFPDSTVEYTVADLLAPPPAWHEAFDLVAECYNVQALPKAVQPDAIVRVGRLVGRGGTLLVIGFSAGAGPQNAGPQNSGPQNSGPQNSGPQNSGPQDGGAQASGPPWPLTRAEVESFATGGLRAVRVDEVADAADVSVRRWLAEFARP